MQTFLMILALAQAATFLGTGVACAVAAIRAPKPSTEELERASMRSLSWPTDGALDSLGSGER